MAVYLTTTGTESPIVIDDWGKRTFTHPTTDYDLLDEFTIDEIRVSTDLQAYVDSEAVVITNHHNEVIKNLSTLSNFFVDDVLINTDGEVLVNQNGNVLLTG